MTAVQPLRQSLVSPLLPPRRSSVNTQWKGCGDYIALATMSVKGNGAMLVAVAVISVKGNGAMLVAVAVMSKTG